jgi:hypothetical protein
LYSDWIFLKKREVGLKNRKGDWGREGILKYGIRYKILRERRQNQTGIYCRDGGPGMVLWGKQKFGESFGMPKSHEGLSSAVSNTRCTVSKVLKNEG